MKNLIRIGLVTALISVSLPVAASNWFYKTENLVSEGSIPVIHRDPNLVNPKALAHGPTTANWVVNLSTGTATIYNGNGNIFPLSVEIAPKVTGKGSPTGMVFNPYENSFIVSENGKAKAAMFIFATADGTISGWSPYVNSQKSIITINDAANGAVYKGLAMGSNGSQKFLYATNFKGGRVEVFDEKFQPVTKPGAFIDRFLPPKFSPFGIQNINGDIYVTYAKPDKTLTEPLYGLGYGVVNVFDADGKFIRRVATFGLLNAPWGIALAPANFGYASNKLLIANVGDGRINFYSYSTNIFVGQMLGEKGSPVQIPGLYGIAFGNGVLDQPINSLFFTATPSQTQGLYGKITPV